MHRASSAERRLRMLSSTAEGSRSTDRYSKTFSPPPTVSFRESAATRLGFRPVVFSIALIVTLILFTTGTLDLRVLTRRTSASIKNQMSASQASSANHFAARLFGRAAASQRDVLLSPISLVSALSLTAVGTTRDSKAEREFKDVLPDGAPKVSKVDAEDVVLSVATSAWLTSGVTSEFRENARKVGAEVRGAPESVDDVNGWVKSVTRGRIPAIMTTLPEQLVGIIINAVYFRASWTTSFDKSQTKPMSFVGLSNRVPMMQMKDNRYPYAEIKVASIPAKLVEIPYGHNEAYSAVVLVPDGDASLDDVIGHLRDNPSAWSDWVGSLKTTKLALLAMPRFKLEYGVQSVKPLLKELGLQTAFEPNPEAPPLARLTDDRDAYIDDVLHKATVECTEEGTVASAATAVVLMTRSMPLRKPPRFVADRPFLFAIRERESGLLLFMGRIDNPKSP